jgi:MFS family permease
VGWLCLKQVWVLLLTNGFHQSVINGSRLLIPLLAADLHVSAFQIGFIAATFSLFPLLLAIKAGAWIDRWGTKTPIIIGNIGIAIAVLVPFLYSSILSLYISQIIAGISQIFVNISLQNTLGLISPKEKRDHFFGWFSFATSGGMFLGPILCGFVADISNSSTAYLAIFALSLIPIVLGFYLPSVHSNNSIIKETTITSTATVVQKELKTFQIIKIHGMKQAIICSMLPQFTKDVMSTYFPLFAQVKGISETGIGLILGIQGLASMIIRMLQGAIIQRFPRRLILISTLTLAGISFALIPFNNHVVYYCLLSVLIGLGIGLAQPLSLTAVVNLSPMGSSGKALGIRITGNRFSQILSPIFFGTVVQLTSLTPVFGICGIILIVGSLYSSSGRSKLQPNRG